MLAPSERVDLISICTPSQNDRNLQSELKRIFYNQSGVFFFVFFLNHQRMRVRSPAVSFCILIVLNTSRLVVFVIDNLIDMGFPAFTAAI